MVKHALIAMAAVIVAACNGSPSQTIENNVAGANVVSSAKALMKKGTTSLKLDCCSKGQPGQVAIADVLSYGGSKPTITAPAGWQLIRDDSAKTTRQSLYWHAIQPNDVSSATWTFSQPVDAQGAILLIDNLAPTAPVDVTSGNAGEGGMLTSKSVATSSDGDLIVSFNATDFGADGLSPKLPPNVSVVVNHEATGREYWILANYQSQMGETEPQASDTPQLFQWVAAQVAIKRGAAAAPTP